MESRSIFLTPSRLLRPHYNPDMNRKVFRHITTYIGDSAFKKVSPVREVKKQQLGGNACLFNRVGALQGGR